MRSKSRRKIESGDRVVLFSGGLDSFLGVVKVLQESTTERIYLVSHSSNATLSRIQKQLQQELKNALSEEDRGRLIWVQASVKPDRRLSLPCYRLPQKDQQDLHQHTRSFLFLSLAACVAISKHIEQVYMFENGPVAVSPTFCEAAINTRTAHPKVLKYFSELINGIFDFELKISNPFENQTKGEVLKEFGQYHPGLLGLTNSCWTYARVRALARGLERKYELSEQFQGLHCGRCLPCLWRRAAFKYAGLSEPKDHYLWDFLHRQKEDHEGLWEDWLDGPHVTMILDQLQFCEQFTSLERTADKLDYCPDVHDVQPSKREAVLKLYERFSREFTGWSKRILRTLPFPPA